MWSDNVVTNAGAALLARWAVGGTLHIDGASAGTGTIDPAALLAATNLVSEKYTPVITRASSEGGKSTFSLRFTAAEEAFVCNQIGIWAHLDNEEQVLLAIYQDSSGFAVPSASETTEFVQRFNAMLMLSNDGSLEVAINSSVYVSFEDLDEVLADFEVTVDDEVTQEGQNAVSGAAVWSFVEEHVPETVPASNVTAGMLAGAVQANETAAAELETAQLRNVVILSSDPGEGAETDYPAGTLVIYA